MNYKDGKALQYDQMECLRMVTQVDCLQLKILTNFKYVQKREDLSSFNPISLIFSYQGGQSKN